MRNVSKQKYFIKKNYFSYLSYRNLGGKQFLRERKYHADKISLKKYRVKKYIAMKKYRNKNNASMKE